MFPITIVFGCLIILLITGLAMNTSRLRAGMRRDSPLEQKEALRLASRTHGNNLEHGLPVILLMLFYEVSSGSAVMLCSIGTVYLATRVVYSIGYLTKPGKLAQIVGAGVTYLTELVLVVLVLMAACAEMAQATVA